MKVITFSRTFPKTHPRAGEPTLFVEKMLIGLLEAGKISIEKCCELAREAGFPEDHPMYYIDTIRWYECTAKFHTIRAGNRWKVGELFSPRVWSGKPYVSKQIEFAPPIKIEKIWDISIKIVNGEDVTVKLNNRSILLQDLMPIALNDGLELNDFVAWFNLHPKKKEQTFTGQIICWNPDLNY
jgi:hypothetical protein